MKNLQKGFAVPILIAIVALLVIGGGIYFYQKNQLPKIATYNLGGGTTLVGSPKEVDTIVKYRTEFENDLRNATNTDICKKYENSGGDLTCVPYIAVKQKNPKLCDFFISGNRIEPLPELKNLCLNEYIINTNDKGACSLMFDSAGKDKNADFWKNESCN